MPGSSTRLPVVASAPVSALLLGGRFAGRYDEGWPLLESRLREIEPRLEAARSSITTSPTAVKRGARRGIEALLRVLNKDQADVVAFLRDYIDLPAGQADAWHGSGFLLQVVKTSDPRSRLGTGSRLSGVAMNNAPEVPVAQLDVCK
jgi:hypothetical protein